MKHLHGCEKFPMSIYADWDCQQCALSLPFTHIYIFCNVSFILFRACLSLSVCPYIELNYGPSIWAWKNTRNLLFPFLWGDLRQQYKLRKQNNFPADILSDTSFVHFQKYGRSLFSVVLWFWNKGWYFSTKGPENGRCFINSAALPLLSSETDMKFTVLVVPHRSDSATVTKTQPINILPSVSKPDRVRKTSSRTHLAAYLAFKTLRLKDQ